jgi:hypothetical protein
MTTKERFWAKVAVRDNGCWEWTGSKRNKGYGAFVYAKANEIIQGRAHRYSWEIHNGDIPEGLCVLHHCDNPSCVNPSHLWLGTKAQNNEDMRRKDRAVKGGTYSRNYVRGLAHHNCRLTDQDVVKVHELRAQGLSYSKIARECGITISHAWKIANGKLRGGAGNG